MIHVSIFILYILYYFLKLFGHSSAVLFRGWYFTPLHSFDCQLNLVCVNSTTVWGKPKIHFSTHHFSFYVEQRWSMPRENLCTCHPVRTLLSPCGIKISLETDHIYLCPQNIHLSFLGFSNWCVPCLRSVFNCPPFSSLSVRVFHRSTPPCPSAELHWVQTRKRSRISPSTAWLVRLHTVISSTFFTSLFYRECTWANKLLHFDKRAHF